MTPLHIACLALVISLVSLWLSIRTARFNAAVKRGELATTLETRLLSIQERYRRLQREVEESRKIAASLGSPELLQAVIPSAEFEGVRRTMEEFKTALASAKEDKIVLLHRLMMAKLTHIDTWLEVVADDAEKLKEQFATVAKKRNP